MRAALRLRTKAAGHILERKKAEGREGEMFIRENCDLCGNCLLLCPYVEYDQGEAVRQFRELLEGGVPEIVSLCVTCVACNQFCEKGANPFDLILSRQEETGVLAIPEENIQLFRNLPQAPSQVVRGAPGGAVVSLCSVGDLVPGLFDGPPFEGCTFLKGGAYSAAWVGCTWGTLPPSARVRNPWWTTSPLPGRRR